MAAQHSNDMAARRLFLALGASLILILWLSSCNRTEYICSAYQSAFFVDKAYANEFFHAKVDADSQPVVSRVQKTQYLLIKPISAKRKEKSWKVVPMITVFPPSLADSTAGDSTQAVPSAGNLEDDGVEKTNFLDIPGESPRQRRRREKQEAKQREKQAKEAEKRKAKEKPEADTPKQADPDKPF